MNIIRNLKYIARVVLAFKEFAEHYSELVGGGSYYPEYKNKRKSKCVIFCDQLFHILKNSYCNYFYFLYGFDIKGFRNESDYVNYTIFMRQRNKMNYRKDYSRIAILRDKVLFDIVASKFGFNKPDILGIVTDSLNFLNYADNRMLSFSAYLKENTLDAYLKVVDGECADGVFHIVTSEGKVKYCGEYYSVDEFINLLPKRTRFILQQKMANQHKAISAIHPKSVNTIRLVTVIDPSTGKPTVFSAVLRVGVNDNEVDNWTAGGLSIGINVEKCELRKFGFYKPGFGTKTTMHPDSHVVFEGYKIPYLKEAIDDALHFHSILYGIHSVGWDIAITENGPCFIEGNDNWEISLMQISNYGLQKKFTKYFYT